MKNFTKALKNHYPMDSAIHLEQPAPERLLEHAHRVKPIPFNPLCLIIRKLEMDKFINKEYITKIKS